MRKSRLVLNFKNCWYSSGQNLLLSPIAPTITWETGETRLELEKGENLDDAQVLENLHPRPPPPHARGLNIHLVELAHCGVCEGLDHLQGEVGQPDAGDPQSQAEQLDCQRKAN